MLAELGVVAISFDLDETLWPLEPVIVDAEQAFYQCLQQHCADFAERFTLDQMRAARLDFVKKKPQLRNDVTLARKLPLRQMLAEAGHDSSSAEHLAEQAMQAFKRVRDQVVPYADVDSALQDLSFHYRLASLTNGNADVNQTSISHYFDCTLAATLELPAKPAPDMFAAACEALGVSPAALLHVGDNPGTDIEGARAFGCRTCWIDRGGVQWPDDLPPADLKIENLHQLVAMAPAVQRPG